MARNSYKINKHQISDKPSRKNGNEDKYFSETGSETKIPYQSPMKISLTEKELIEGILSQDRIVLAQSITMAESSNTNHQAIIQKVLNSILPKSGKSVRIGITGSPGVGKSSLIEVFGNFLCGIGHKVAVLAIDPSSSRSGGSILGDKTRMESLSQNSNAFIRPSPSSGILGGVAKSTRECIFLCEAAGFDIIIIETIGVGQSEITARSMTDFMILLLMPDAGDELQGIKKGSVELADLIIVNKADNGNIEKAQITAKQYAQALHYIEPATLGWRTRTITASALENKGIETIWESIQNFIKITRDNSSFDKRRSLQSVDWFTSLLKETIISDFFNSGKIVNKFNELKEKILNEKINPTSAVSNILNYYRKQNETTHRNK